MTLPGYSVAVVTFRRAETLHVVLTSVAAQDPPPLLTVVADNDPDGSARLVVERLRHDWPGELDYVSTGENLGPAGGWAMAVSRAQGTSDMRGKYVLIIDDDDPIQHSGVAAELLRVADKSPEKTAAVGLRGARLERSRGLLRRVEPSEGAIATADYLASNGMPLYKWAALDDLGFFKPDLFFGFEDLDLGLRLTEAGRTLLVISRPTLHVVGDTASTRSPWREYYKHRSLVWILTEHSGHRAVLTTLLRSTVLGGARLAISHRNLDLWRARLLGSFDGLRGRLGDSTYRPSENPAKDQT